MFNGNLYFYNDEDKINLIGYSSLINTFLSFEDTMIVNKTNYFTFSLRFNNIKTIYYCCCYLDFIEVTSKLILGLNWYNSSKFYLKNNFVLEDFKNSCSLTNMLQNDNFNKNNMSIKQTGNRTNRNSINNNLPNNTQYDEEMFNYLKAKNIEEEFTSNFNYEFKIKKSSPLFDYEIIELLGKSQYSHVYSCCLKVDYEIYLKSKNNISNYLRGSVVQKSNAKQSTKNTYINQDNNRIKNLLVMKILRKSKMKNIDVINLRREIAILKY